MHKYKIYPNEFPEPWASEWGEDRFGLWMAFTFMGVRQVFRWIEPGEFEMGSPEGEPERFNDEIKHTVNLTQGFWLADSTVTQALWQVVMKENLSKFKGENLPVDSVSWDNAKTFIDEMNSMKPELKLCLPSEAQWEYACRAGTSTPFSFAEQIDSELVNFDGTEPYNKGMKSGYREKTVEIKTLPPNQWGLYEMHGNIWEWCQDWYGDYPDELVTDPQGPETGGHRVVRGGSWFNSGGICRSAYRNDRLSDSAYYSIGFRLALGH